MGTTLTGTTPQDTYDSLIKVTDNGPIKQRLNTYLMDWAMIRFLLCQRQLVLVNHGNSELKT
jgi:hypothetical protein